MLGVVDLPTYVLGVIAIILLPGPNSMFCLTVGAQYGIAKGYQAIAAVFLGDLVLMTLAALGAASVMVQYPAVFNVVKYVGGGYLAYLSIRMMMGAVKGWMKPAKQPNELIEPVLSSPNVFGRALILSLLNPKAILFFISFFVQFVDPHYPHPVVSFAVLASILQIVSLTYLTVLIFAGAHLVRWFRSRQKIAAAGLASVGALFMSFAVKLWTATIA